MNRFVCEMPVLQMAGVSSLTSRFCFQNRFRVNQTPKEINEDISVGDANAIDRTNNVSIVCILQTFKCHFDAFQIAQQKCVCTVIYFERVCKREHNVCVHVCVREFI